MKNFETNQLVLATNKNDMSETTYIGLITFNPKEQKNVFVYLAEFDADGNYEFTGNTSGWDNLSDFNIMSVYDVCTSKLIRVLNSEQVHKMIYNGDFVALQTCGIQ